MTSKSTKTKTTSETTDASENNQRTLVSLYDVDDFAAHHCGYCNQDGNISIGMSSEIMRIEDYQNLIDRGWRRSGTYLYKPCMDKTCCPLYTIKCDATKFELRKSQKSTLKKVRKYLEKNELKNRSDQNDSQKSNTSNKRNRSSSGSSSNQEEPSKNDKNNNNKQTLVKLSNENILNKLNGKKTRNNNLTNARKVINYFIDKKNDLTSINEQQQPEKILDIPKLKSKQKRLFRKLLKLSQKNLINSYEDIEKNLKRKLPMDDDDRLENYLNITGNAVNKMELKLVRSWPPTREFEDSLGEVHKLYTKYQTKVHNDSPLECNLNQFRRFLCTSPLMKTSYTGGLNKYVEKMNEVDLSISGDVSSIGYGSYHQHYRINGKLVAVGVIDILTNCVSSVYFFYDPDFAFLNMGIYSAIREIAFVRQINKIDPNIKWYYLGFFVNTCRKMRYKGFFYPSYLLCPETYSWHPIEFCVELLEKNKYSRFASNQTLEVDKNESIDDVRIRIKFRSDSQTTVIKFSDLCDYLNPDFVPRFKYLIEGYCKLFGSKFSRNVLIKF